MDPERDAELHETPWMVDILVALDRQLRHVEQHLSYYFSPNTHLTGEALALYVVGHALPELAASDRWRDTGRRILLREIERQILPDGGHAERSTHYQRYTLDFYLLALLTAEHNRDIAAIAPLKAAVTRLAGFTRTLADDRGRLPLVGDDDGGMLWPIKGRECHDVRDSLALAALVLGKPGLAPWGLQEEVFWMAPRTVIERASLLERSTHGLTQAQSQTFGDTGYVVVRDHLGGHAVFDAGAHGYLNAGHAHADALSLTVTLANLPLLIDPGTSTYTMDRELRDRLRGTSNHNTVTIDGRSQSEPAGPFHWRTSANARLHDSRHNPHFDWAEASHDGYPGITHRRSLLSIDGIGWLVVDEILPGLTSDPARLAHLVAAAHWHFDPAWMLRTDARGRLCARHLEGTEAWVLHDGGDLSLVHGDDASGLGWCAPVYGTLIPTWTARISRRDVPPFSMITWIAPAPASTAAPALARVDTTTDGASPSIAARISAGDDAATFILRPGEPRIREGRACGVPEYQTNARLLHFRTRANGLLAFDVLDASHLLALRDGWVSIEASEPIADLHAVLVDGALDLSSSAPPRQLRLQGDSIWRLRTIWLNRRRFSIASADQTSSLFISGSDWGMDPSKTQTGARFATEVAHLVECHKFPAIEESPW